MTYPRINGHPTKFGTGTSVRTLCIIVFGVSEGDIVFGGSSHIMTVQTYRAITMVQPVISVDCLAVHLDDVSTACWGDSHCNQSKLTDAPQSSFVCKRIIQKFLYSTVSSWTEHIRMIIFSIETVAIMAINLIRIQFEGLGWGNSFKFMLWFRIVTWLPKWCYEDTYGYQQWDSHFSCVLLVLKLISIWSESVKTAHNTHT